MSTSNQFRILIVEDNEFFNRLLTNQLQWYAGEIAMSKNCRLNIDSYVNMDDCLQNLRYDTDMAFIDYYMGDEKTSVDIIKKLEEKSPACKVIVISQSHDAKSAVNAFQGIPVEFLYKDMNALPKSCFIAEEAMNDKLRKA